MTDKFTNGQLHTSQDGTKYMYDAAKDAWLPLPGNVEAKAKTPESDLGTPANTRAEDTWRAATETGPVKAAAGLLGFPADAVEMGARAHNDINQKVSGWLGNDPGPVREPQNPGLGPFGGSADMQKSIENNVLGGPTYKPKTGVGHAAALVSENVANPLSYVGGTEAKLLRPLTRGVGPAMVQDATEKFTDNPYVQAGAAMLAGNQLGRRIATPFPATEALHATQAQQVAKALKDSGSEARVSAGRYGNPMAAAIEARTGVPKHMGQDALDRGFTQAEFDIGGVKGVDSTRDVKTGKPVIPDYLRAPGNEMGALEKAHIPASRLSMMVGTTPAEKKQIQLDKLDYIRKNAPPDEVKAYEDARRRYAHLSDMDTANQTGSKNAAAGKVTPDAIVNQMDQGTPGHALGIAGQSVLGPQKQADLDLTARILGAGAGYLTGHGQGNLYGLGGATAGGVVGPTAVDATLKALGKTGLTTNPVTQWWMKNQGIPAGTKLQPRTMRAITNTSSARNPDEEQ